MKCKFYFLMGSLLMASQSQAVCTGEGSPYNSEQFKKIASAAIGDQNSFMGKNYKFNPESEIAVGSESNLKFSTMVASNHITDLLPFKKSGSNDCSIDFAAKKIGGSESKIRCSFLISPSKFYTSEMRKSIKASDEQMVAALYECYDITDLKNKIKLDPRMTVMPEGVTVFSKNQIEESTGQKKLEINDVGRAAVKEKDSSYAAKPASATVEK